MSLPQQMCDWLNDLLKTDPQSVSKLMDVHVECTPEMEEHPHVVVGGDLGTPPTLGPLGLLNGFLRAYETRWTFGPIVAVVEDDGTITEFHVHQDNNMLPFTQS